MNVFDSTEALAMDKTRPIIEQLDQLDPWMSADYHSYKELKNGNTDVSRTEDIIAMHNKYVKPGDYFVFLGDICESEFFDQDKTKILEYVKKCFNRLNGIKVLITGNNDTAKDDSFYKELGFVEIYKDMVETEDYVISHKPIPNKGKLNIHGHIHGSKEYWGMDAANHIDAYFGLYGQPVKLSFLKDYYAKGKYVGITKKDKPLDI